MLCFKKLSIKLPIPALIIISGMLFLYKKKYSSDEICVTESKPEICCLDSSFEALSVLTYSQLTNKHCDLSYQHYCGNVDNSSINDLYYYSKKLKNK